MGVSGVVLTKIDGVARGGAALSVVSVVGVPFAFVGSGVRLEDLEPFLPDRIVSRVLGMGETKSSVLLQGGVQADLRLVAADSRGAALQYFTGSKAHNIALRDRAIGLGFKLNEYGLFRLSDDVRVAGEREEDIYRALGLDWVPPELRERRR